MTDRAHMPQFAAPEAALLRGADRGRERRLRVAAARRVDRGGALLHLGHDRQPEGRAVCAPLDGAARLRARRCRTSSRRRRARRSCRSCRCSTSTRGASRISRTLNGCKLVFPGGALDGKSLYELFEAEQVTVTAGVPTVWLGLLDLHEGERPQVLHAAARHRRRLGGAAGDDPAVRGRLRGRLPARLGHDRDEPARHAAHAQDQARRARRARALRAALQAGPHDLRRRDEDRRRRRAGSCRATARRSATCWCAGRG